jgi:hypothetical protein
MNTNLKSSSGSRITVDVPVTVRLPRGSAVFVIRGEAWITQDGSLEDVFLRGGQRFDVASRAPLVISATRGQVDLHVVGPAAARVSASCNLHDFLRAHAAELRRAESSRLLAAVTVRARAWLHRLPSAVRPRLRVTTN